MQEEFALIEVFLSCPVIRCEPVLSLPAIFFLNTDTLKVVFEVDDVQASKYALDNTNWYKKIESVSRNSVTFTLEQNEISEINKLLVEKGIAVSAVIPKRSLEEYFLKITSEAN